MLLFDDPFAFNLLDYANDTSCPLCRRGELIIPQDFLRRIFSAGAEHAAAGVAGCAAQVQAADGRAVIGPAGDGAEAE